MDAKQVPLRELLASVPADARLLIDDADGKGSRSIPVGRLCQEAAAALAEPVQEPVAWASKRTLDRIKDFDGTIYANGGFNDAVPLYSRPQPQQTEPSQDTPPQHEYEVTANDDGTFSVELPDGEELRIIPPQRKPLTDEELYKVFPAIAGYIESNKALYRSIARAIERAHGIGDNT